MAIRPVVVVEFLAGVVAAVLFAWAVIAVVTMWTEPPSLDPPPSRPTGTTVLEP